MKRVILATTAVIALSAPAFAQSQTEIAVSNALVHLGYDASVVEMLSDAQVAELFVAVNSEFESAIRSVIDGFGIGESAAADGAGDNAQLTTVADQALVAAGYPEGTVAMLSDAEVTELYTAATSESEASINIVIDGLTFGMGDMESEAIVSSSDRFVAASLMARGVEESTIMNLTSSELAELFIAFTSGSQSEVDAALESVEAS